MSYYTNPTQHFSNMNNNQTSKADNSDNWRKNPISETPQLQNTYNSNNGSSNSHFGNSSQRDSDRYRGYTRRPQYNNNNYTRDSTLSTNNSNNEIKLTDSNREAIEPPNKQQQQQVYAPNPSNVRITHPTSDQEAHSSLPIDTENKMTPQQYSNERQSLQQWNNFGSYHSNKSKDYHNNDLMTKKSNRNNNWRNTNNRPYSQQRHTNNREFFDPYMSLTEIEKGIQESSTIQEGGVFKVGSIFQGIMRLGKNRNDAYVTSEQLDNDIYIGGSRDRNRALHGDLVAVKLVEVDSVWDKRKVREEKRKEENRKRWDEKNGIAQVESEEEVETAVPSEEEEEEEDQHKPVYCGVVVGILLRPDNISYVGVITASRHASDNNENKNPTEQQANNNSKKSNNSSASKFAWFKPNDKRVPFIALRPRDAPQDILENEEYYRTNVFVANIESWKIDQRNPAGRIVDNLGSMGELDVERSSLLADNNITNHEFSPIALECLPQVPWCIPGEEFKVRKDLRSERVFSIDPKTAKDLDDALHIKKLEDGLWEVGVHIADVSYFLKDGTALDTEARARGTSTYLVDSVIPMLPSLLCEELCSLNPGVERLAFSVIWKMDDFGNPIDTWFGKSIIKSCSKLAYEDAQAVIEGKNLPDGVVIHNGQSEWGVTEDIVRLFEISNAMRKRRYESGSLSMNSVKLTFDLNEQGEPESVSAFEAKEANRLIEEFMLLANISVAKEICEAFPNEALLRRHQEPLPRRIREFEQLTEDLGFDFDIYSAGGLQESFNKIKNKSIKDVLLVLAIRSMQRAKYFCAGSLDASKYVHYALNEEYYTHFTSPIRRYADVMVHRILEAALAKKDSCGYEKKQVQKISFSCNFAKDNAKNAQDASINLYLAKYLSNLEIKDGPIYKEAFVIMVGKEAYDVYVPDFGMEKRIHKQSLPVELFQYDKHTHELDIYWKRNVPVTMHSEEKIYAQGRERQDDYSNSEDEDEDEADDITQGMQHLKIENEEDAIPPVILDEETCMQGIKMFSTISVRIQVNNKTSPPFINVYPVNPFCGEEDSI